MSIEEVEAIMKAEHQKLKKAKADSMRTLAMDQKLPENPPKFQHFTQSKVSTADQR